MTSYIEKAVKELFILSSYCIDSSNLVPPNMTYDSKM